MLSRGMMPNDKKWEMFHKGPEFLYRERSTWGDVPQPFEEVVVGALEADVEEPVQALVDCSTLDLV